jgi:hypothetical protein
MKTLFVVISLLGIAYFLFKKRRFDVFSMAFFSSIIYFSPGYVGKVIYLSTFTLVDIVNETYLVFNLVLVFMLLTTWLYDYTHSGRSQLQEKIFRNEGKIPLLALIIGGLGCFMFFAEFGNVMFSDISKTAKLDEISGTRWHILWNFGTTFCLLLAYYYKKRKILFLAIVLILLNVYIGHRSTAALAFLALLLMAAKDYGKTNLIHFLSSRKRFLVFSAILFVGFFFYVYKGISFHLLQGRYDVVTERLTSSDYYLRSFEQSEPFGIQSNLNSTLSKNIKNDPIHPGDVLVNSLLFGDILGYEQYGNYLDQTDIYGQLDSGAGNNIWAFIWSSNGWFGLLFFIIFFNWMLWLMNNWVLRYGGFRLAIVVYSAAYFAFYIHRNTLLYQINLQKRILLIALLLFILLSVFNQLPFLKNSKMQSHQRSWS